MTRIGTAVTISPLFLLLSAAYPVLFIAVSNPGQAAWSTVAATVSACLVVALTLLGVVRPLVRSWNSAALSVTIVAILFYLYGPIHTLLEGVFLDTLNETSGFALYLQRIAPYLHPIVSAVWVAGGFIALRRLARMPDTWIPHIARFCNAMSLALVVLLMLQWIAFHDTTGPASIRARSSVANDRRAAVLGYNPDVYMIVLDGYAREDVLREHYQFDNAEFLDGLRSRGFHVSRASTANYNWTFLSLASMLNMDYLQPLLGDRVATSARGRAPVYDAVRNNAVARFLKERGYRIVHFQTTWGATLTNPYADEQIACHEGLFTDEFLRVLAEASWLKALQSRMSADIANCHLSNLDRLMRMGRESGPKFVFAHFLPPHHPYLFDRHGNILRGANLSNQFEFQKRLWEEKAMYVDQLVYMNHRIIEAVDRILSTSPRPPVIVIQSDHGPNLERDITRDDHIRIRLANFAAYRLPGAPDGLMPADGSAVNQFRRILNYYFNAQFAILPTRHYFSEFDRPYAFRDVTRAKDTGE